MGASMAKGASSATGYFSVLNAKSGRFCFGADLGAMKMEQNQVDRIVEAINECFEAQNIILLRISAVLERMEITLKLMSAILTQQERNPDEHDAASTGEDNDV
jgi:hypothetical protein